MFKLASHKSLSIAAKSRSAQSFSAFYAVSVPHPPLPFLFNIVRSLTLLPLQPIERKKLPL